MPVVVVDHCASPRRFRLAPPVGHADTHRVSAFLFLRGMCLMPCQQGLMGMSYQIPRCHLPRYRRGVEASGSPGRGDTAADSYDYAPATSRGYSSRAVYNSFVEEVVVMYTLQESLACAKQQGHFS